MKIYCYKDNRTGIYKESQEPLDPTFYKLINIKKNAIITNKDIWQKGIQRNHK